LWRILGGPARALRFDVLALQDPKKGKGLSRAQVRGVGAGAVVVTPRAAETRAALGAAVGRVARGRLSAGRNPAGGNAASVGVRSGRVRAVCRWTA